MEDERARPGGVLGDDEGDDMSTKKKKKLSKPTTTTHKALTPPLRGMSDEGRPKREIHPPPSKDYPETMTKRRANNPRKNDVQMKFCIQALKELKKTKYRDINYPFLAPVDVVALNIPDYVNIVKHPMDMSTIEQKLNEGEYENPDEFENDIRLMFNNCYLYNPATLPIHKMARDLEKVFDAKWDQLPPAPEPVQDKTVYEDEQHVEEEEEEEESEDDDRDDKIAELERHIASISQQIASIKSKKKPVEKTARRPSRSTKEKKTATREKKKRTNSTSSSHTKKMNHTAKRKTTVAELPEFTFDQKKDLSEEINNLTGERLNTVVTIIQNSMPNLDGQGQEEIVLDIDSLDRATLHQLHEFVKGESLATTNSKSSAPSKRQRTHYSQADNNRKIRELDTMGKYSPDSSSGSESDSDSGSDSDDSGSSSD
ncbi:Bromodomain-containing protein [Backusella circina FSU 941]|nr:Bromodomain-containing protein [Backusella circina FSU 941]